MSLRRPLLRLLHERIPGWNLGLARIGIGFALLLTLIEVAPRLYLATRPGVLLMPRFEWLPTPTAGLSHALVAGWGLGALGLLLGWKTRVSGSLAVLVLAFVLVLDAQLFSNHLYLLLCLSLLLTVADGDASYAVATFSDTRARSRAVPAWPVVLLKLQLSIVYFFAAVSKLNEMFLSGAMLGAYVRGGLIDLPEMLRIVEVLAPLAWFTVLLELYLAVAFWSERRRAGALWLGLAFHTALTVTMAATLGLAAFGVAMFALYPLFFPTRAEFIHALRHGPFGRNGRADREVGEAVGQQRPESRPTSVVSS